VRHPAGGTVLIIHEKISSVMHDAKYGKSLCLATLHSGRQTTGIAAQTIDPEFA